MSEKKIESLAKRLTLTKEMLQKKKVEVPSENRKADSELRRLKRIVRRVANKKRRLSPPAKGASTKES
jgi:hypothetical protein